MYLCKCSWDNFGWADAAFVIENDVDRLFWIISDSDKVQIAGADEFVFVLHASFHPFEQAVPKFAAETNQRELRDASGLDKREHFIEFIERAKAAWHENKADAVFHKAHLPRKEVVE